MTRPKAGPLAGAALLGLLAAGPLARPAGAADLNLTFDTAAALQFAPDLTFGGPLGVGAGTGPATHYFTFQVTSPGLAVFAYSAAPGEAAVTQALFGADRVALAPLTQGYYASLADGFYYDAVTGLGAPAPSAPWQVDVAGKATGLRVGGAPFDFQYATLAPAAPPAVPEAPAGALLLLGLLPLGLAARRRVSFRPTSRGPV